MLENKQTFSTGAQRDNEDEKLRYDLIPVEGLTRLAKHYTTGAKHYGENNWAKGIPFLRYYSSILRHLFQWRIGDNSEDHLAAIAWGCMSLMHHENKIALGLLPVELDSRVEGMYEYPVAHESVTLPGQPNDIWYIGFNERAKSGQRAYGKDKEIWVTHKQWDWLCVFRARYCNEQLNPNQIYSFKGTSVHII